MPRRRASPRFGGRAQQDAALRRTRPLWLVFLVVMFVNAVRAHPGAGLHGGGLAVSVALSGITAGALGVLGSHHVPDHVGQVFVAVLFLSSAMLVWLQPAGPGLFGLLAAVGAAARLVKALRGAALAIAAVVFLGLAYEFAGGHRHASPVVLGWLGLVAVYTAVSSARRVREGDEQAEKLLIELEKTRAAQVRAAALAERQRLAREMHDVLAHSLSGLVLQLEGARLLSRENPADPRLGGAIDRAHHLAKSGLQEARRAIGMLRDDELPGPDRLAGLVADFEGDSGIASRFAVTGEERSLDSGTTLALYRVTQEALTNIRKHACPGRTEVWLRYEPDGVRLTVEDFAAAGSPPRPRAGGPPSPPPEGAAPAAGCSYGLTGMRERAELLGGTLSAAPTESGFRVELWVPACGGGSHGHDR